MILDKCMYLTDSVLGRWKITEKILLSYFDKQTDLTDGDIYVCK